MTSTFIFWGDDVTNQVMENFKQAIYTELHQIPRGTVVSYGKLATLAGQPNYARQVGRILKKLPKDTKLPWYRVVKSNMKIAFPVNSNTYTRQKLFLEKEGWKVEGERIIPST